jgi:hypothetical protein
MWKMRPRSQSDGRDRPDKIGRACNGSLEPEAAAVRPPVERAVRRLNSNYPRNSGINYPCPPDQDGKDGKDVGGTNRSVKHKRRLARLRKDATKLVF